MYIFIYVPLSRLFLFLTRSIPRVKGLPRLTKMSATIVTWFLVMAVLLDLNQWTTTSFTTTTTTNNNNFMRKQRQRQLVHPESYVRLSAAVGMDSS